MSISEQVKELRELAKGMRNTGMLLPNWRYKTLEQAADTIESLSAKLQEANMKRSADCRSCGSGCVHWDLIHGGCTIHNTVPDGCKDFCQTQKSDNLADCVGWIPCKEMFPKERIDVLVSFEDNYNPLVAWYSSVNHHWKNACTDSVIKAKVTAWRPLPDPYHET